ncbi:uncharacterized protein LOC110011267 isoform X2 [Sesamum indicum]|uniref:Uncharacterized protein LOC110011267 isoform X2 n=1 Tax=Sesamum indicum TaxID=4182 RepID=A0A8M8UN79_SESIN|nr:uncharacterized protein LOC110011267 isoform X2 [Sesamum indicum]
MNRLESTLAPWQRDGQCQGLLESPTYFPSPLCSVLALNQKQKLMILHDNLTHSSSRPNPDTDTDPISHGGGFIPETQPSGNPVTPTPVTTNAKREETRLAPTSFYALRTRTQITQMIREYKKISYRVPTAVLVGGETSCEPKNGS